MKGLISVYLDMLRFLAAMGVFLWHAEQPSISTGIFPVEYFNHLMVIIFFVISGYVIAASASRPDRTVANYAADRLSRLSSVVIPALVLTYVLDAIGSRVSPEIYASVSPHWQALRMLVNLLYCQQIWFFCVNPSSNNPFWSLGYEFWYYVLYGIWIFVKPGRKAVLLLIMVSLFVGPKILLLLPAWAAGAIALRVSKGWRLAFPLSLGCFVATGVAAVIVLIWGGVLGLNNGRAGQPPLYYSSNFMGDNVFAIILSANFLFCALISRHFNKNLEPYRVVKLIRWMAGHTFSLYLYHLPILWCIRAVTKYDPHNTFSVLAAISVTLLIIVGFSKITEERYPALRALLRRWITQYMEGMQTGTAASKLQPNMQKQ